MSMTKSVSIVNFLINFTFLTATYLSKARCSLFCADTHTHTHTPLCGAGLSTGPILRASNRGGREIGNQPFLPPPPFDGQQKQQ